MIPSVLHFLEQYQGSRLLYLCHYGADGDAIGSAAALSFMFPGDVGVVHHIRRYGSDLADKLNLDYVIDPDLSAYNAVMMLDIAGSQLLAHTPVPPLYAIIDHHRSSEENNLAPGAFCYYIRRASSTCELVYDLLQYAEIPLNQQLAYPLIWGICGDTGIRTGQARSLDPLVKLVDLMRVSGITPTGFTEFSESSKGSVFRRRVLEAIQNADIDESNNWILASTVVSDEDTGLIVYRTLKESGAHVSIVGFRCDDRIFVRMMADLDIRKETGLDLRQVRDSLKRRYGGGGFGGPGNCAYSVITPATTVDAIVRSAKKDVNSRLCE